MPGHLTPEQFVQRAVGLPWVRWRSDWSAADCWGLVALWFREVLGVELGPVPHTDIACGFAAARGWVECEPQPGSTGFMVWRGDAPTHCGVLALPGHLLHSMEGPARFGRGSVQLTRLPFMQRACPDLRFYRYEGAAC